MKKVLLVLLMILTVASVFAQRKLQVIKATSKTVDIKDGDGLLKGIWGITPEVKPDIYYANRFKGSKQVSFYTDIDSISFNIEPGKVYNFIIILNGKDSAYTQISAALPVKYEYKKDCSNCNTATDTIPFTIGWKNNIKFKGRINNSNLLDMMFDTGANGIVLSDNAYSKNTKVKIDGTVQGGGFGGTSQDELSKSNELHIGQLTWNNISLTVKHQGKPNADVVIGYNVFDGRVIEINYDKQVLVIHKNLPAVKDYILYPLKFNGGLSFIKVLLYNGIKKMEALFDFDTGSSETLFINNETATENELYNSMKKIGSDKLKGGGPNKIQVDKMQLPNLLLAGNELKDVPVGVEVADSKEGPPFNIIGNDVLKRFNAIIDYENDVVYLKPNSLINNKYLSEKVNYVIWTGVALAAIIVAVIFTLYQKRRKRKAAGKK